MSEREECGNGNGVFQFITTEKAKGWRGGGKVFQFITTCKTKDSSGGGKVSVLWKTKRVISRILKSLSH